MNAGIIIIGPSARRYKGGVARFASGLYEAIEEKHSVEFCSWRRLYPTATRYLAGTKADQDDAFLDILRPGTWNTVLDQITQRKPALILINWVHPIHCLVFRRLLRRLQHHPSVWVICHNVAPHESVPAMGMLTRSALRHSKGLIVHSESAAIQARKLFPKKPLLKIFLPPLEKAGEDLDGNDDGRQRILFFGHLRPHKGLEILLKAFQILLREFPETILTIAGEPLVGSLAFGASERFLTQLQKQIQKLGIANSTELIPEYLERERLVALLQQSQIAVFPLLSATPSGSVVTALEYGLPVIVSRFEGAMEFIHENVNGSFANPGDADDLALKMKQLLINLPSKRTVRESMQAYSWENYVGILLKGVGYIR